MNPQLKIKSYMPEGSSYAPRIRNEQWDQYKPLLRHLHDEGHKRAAMLDILRKQNFNPSMGQLNAKMTAWGFKVYGTQVESQDQGSNASPPGPFFDFADAEMADFPDSDPTLSPTSGRSISSTTLHEPERRTSIPHSDRNLTLDEVIILQCLSLSGSYGPFTKPSDFGFRAPGLEMGIDEVYCHSVMSVADFLCAVHCFEQAFDLYYHILEHLVTRDIGGSASLVRGLVQCAISATTDAQSAYTLSVIRRAHAYCVDHVMLELASCFSSLSRDLTIKDAKANDFRMNSQTDRLSDMPLLIATDPNAKSVAYRKEWLKQQLAGCDETCGTLAHLSVWCQDVLSFYQLENQAVSKFSPTTTTGQIYEVTSFEHDFQIMVSALIIDYLNSPGPSMKRAEVECKENHCPFRGVLPPSTSLIIMAHLIYEPVRLQTQSTTNTYLQTRAQQFGAANQTTSLQELKAFASVDSESRCSAFVDTFLKRFNTTLAFRRFVSNVACNWDRITAAKRLAQVLQSNQSGLLPHSGLPVARRSVLRTMVAPFGIDPSFTDNRPSITSDSGSMGEFQRLATQIGMKNAATGSLTPSDAMSIDTRSSWSFNHVTGYMPTPMSGRNSLSSRRDEMNEIEEYRHFIKDNNYSQQSLLPDSKTPTQRFSTPAKRE